jgi:hypothetical protein
MEAHQVTIKVPHGFTMAPSRLTMEPWRLAWHHGGSPWCRGGSPWRNGGSPWRHGEAHPCAMEAHQNRNLEKDHSSGSGWLQQSYTAPVPVPVLALAPQHCPNSGNFYWFLFSDIAITKNYIVSSAATTNLPWCFKMTKQCEKICLMKRLTVLWSLTAGDWMNVLKKVQRDIL